MGVVLRRQASFTAENASLQFEVRVGKRVYAETESLTCLFSGTEKLCQQPGSWHETKDPTST